MSGCIFCKIVRNEIPSETVEDRPDFIVIKDITPKAPIHLLLIPKKHIKSLLDIDQADKSLLGSMLYETNLLASKHGLKKGGYKVVINTGKDSGQLVPHLHIHFLGGKKMSEFA